MVGDGNAEPGGPSTSTLADRGRASHGVGGSEFIAYAAPVHGVEEVEAIVEEVRSGHPDATHVVPAYRVRDGDGVLHEHQDDAGEPTGTAGKPALTLLRRRGLEDLVVVIVRYFGGTELGVGGLARAYGEAAKRAVAAAGVTDRVPQQRLTIQTTYDDSGTVRGILESEAVEFEADYGEVVRFDATVAAVESDRITDRLLSATSGRADIEVD